MADSSQKFIARNRAPRVQIEYDVELYGSEKKVQLPFVMGVMSDLAGKSRVPQPSVEERKFLEIDADNFDERMKAMAPRAAFSVPNTLTGEGNLSIDLTFESLKDFSPGAIAARVEALRPLLEARQQLTNLMAYMDGKSGAEALIEKILADPALLAAAASGNAGDGTAAALDTLRGQALPPGDEDNSGDILDALGAQAPEEAAPEDEAAGVLSALSAAEPEDISGGDDSGTVLDSLARAAPPAAPEGGGADDVLAGLADAAAPEPEPEDEAGSVLDALAAEDLPVPPDDDADDALAGLAAAPVAAPPTGDHASDVLEALSELEVPEAEEDDLAGAALETLAGAETEEPPADDGADILGELAAADQPQAADDSADLGEVLGAIAPAAEEAEDAAELDDVLGALEAPAPDGEEDSSAGDVLAGLELAADSEPEQEGGGLSAILDAIEETADAEPGTADAELDNLLPESGVAEESTGELVDLLSGFAGGESGDADGGPDAAEAGGDDLDSLLGDLTEEGLPEAVEEQDDIAGLQADEGPDLAKNPDDDEDGGLDDLLSELEAGGDDTGAEDPEALAAESGADVLEEAEADAGGLDALLGDLGLGDDDNEETGDLDGLLADLGDESAAEADADPELDLDALLAGEDEGGDQDLDALLGDLGDEDNGEAAEAGGPELEALLGDAETGAGADAAQGSEAAAAADGTGAAIAAAGFAFGTVSAARPEPQKLVRKRFRLAILGDFSGRAAAGRIETGAALAGRKARVLDPDTAEDVIASFATELVLPVGKEGAGIAVPLKGLDDLHPDELFENVELFAELVGLRKQLQSGATAEHAAQTLKAWGEKHGQKARPPKRSSGGNAVPAGCRLSAFEQLMRDTERAVRRASPVHELLERVVGPHIRALPDPDAAAMQKAVDAALSDAMRLLLHHPEFQSLEAQWRSLDLIARSVEVDDTLDVMLYDISAEELAADLAASDDLAQSGFARLLTEEPLDEENGRGGYSALIGLYQFEETPPHAELLGRIARVAAHVDAPFFAAVSPAFLKTPKAERPKLVAEAWDTLQGMAEAGHLGLVTPRFLLRRPYGAKTEPCYEFEFEEFTESEGLRGMLWANPAVLVAVLLARSFKANGPALQLGKIMSLGGMPYHYVTDRFGDQVALPCTERNIDLDKIAMAQARGFMAVSSVKGRDEVRLTSFHSVRGGEILGPWTGLPAPEPSPPDPRPAAPAPDAAGGDDDQVGAGPDGGDGGLDLDDLGLDDLDLGGGDDDGSGLDDLLASFADDGDGGGDDGGMDAELAALLEDL